MNIMASDALAMYFSGSRMFYENDFNFAKSESLEGSLSSVTLYIRNMIVGITSLEAAMYTYMVFTTSMEYLQSSFSQ